MRIAFARRYDRFTARMEEVWLDRSRAELLAGLSGTVVEIGAGTGKNLRHYPDSVERLVLTEPTAAMRDQLQSRVESTPRRFPIEILDATADDLPLPDGSADAVVSTLVLCSVPSLADAVEEVRRVLRPDGELRLVEHVAAARPRVRRLQGWLDGPWNWIEGSCHLDHDTRTALVAGGFDVSGVREGRQKGMPPLLNRVARGRATPVA